MSAPKHTPGPWAVNHGWHGTLGQEPDQMTPFTLVETNCVTNGPEATICLLGINTRGERQREAISPDGGKIRVIEDDEIEANARLIAAAPELLEFIQRWENEITDGGVLDNLQGWQREFAEEARTGRTFARYCDEIDFDSANDRMIYHRRSVQMRGGAK